MGEVSIEDLSAQLVHAKREEQAAKEARIKIEESIIAQYKLGESERKTVKAGNGLKLTLQAGLNYKLAKDAPECVPTKTKTELDTKAYEELRKSDPQAFAEASKYVTVTPKKTSIAIAVG